MSLSKSNNYSVMDVDKSCMKSNLPQDEEPITNTRRYNIKRLSDLKNEHKNQNNTLCREDRQFRHRNHVSTDPIQKGRYKSYDYLPARRPPMDHYRNNFCSRREAYNDYSDSTGDNQDDSHEALRRFRKSYSYGGSKPFSSNEELDISYNYDVDVNPSSESSHPYQYRTENFMETRNDFRKTYRHNDFENKKYQKSWNHDHMNSYHEPRRYSRYSSVATKFCKSPKTSNLKEGLRGTSYPSYLNNNRSDSSPRKLSTTQSRYDDINKDNYSSHHKEILNRNMMSLKSTYRKNENVPHSGTRLENHRKQFDKYCTDRSRGARFNESNNCEDDRKNSSMILNRSSKMFRTNLPPSPKYSSTHKKYSNVKTPISSKYSTKEKFTTPRRSQTYCRDPNSENESCYFKNSHNTNNEHTSRYHKNIKESTKLNYPSVSDELSTSSIAQSQEKPTESMPLSISTPKFNSNIKTIQSDFNRPNCFADHLNMPSAKTKRCLRSKEPTGQCHHSERSSRYRSSFKHH